MGSINQWHKSVFFACMALVLITGVAKAQPADYSQNVQSIVYVFEAAEDGFLDGIGLWDIDMEGFLVQIYDDNNFDLATNTFGTFSASVFGGSSVVGEEYAELLFSSALSLTAEDTYAVRVQALMGPNHGVTFDSLVDNATYYLDSGTWHDLYDDYSGVTYVGSSTPAPANFVVDLLTSSLPNITASKVLGDNWALGTQSFDGTSTLDLEATATEMEPMVKLIDVESDMDQMTLTEEVLNDIAERDWIGFGFQLGYWDEENERFIASTEGDGLDFGYSTSGEFGNATTLSEDYILFSNGLGLVEPGETASFELLINLPGGSDNFSFALRQYAVPEPSTFLLLVMSGVMMLLCGRRRR